MGNFAQKIAEQGTGRIEQKIRFDIWRKLARVLKREVFDSRLQKEIEGIERR